MEPRTVKVRRLGDELPDDRAVRGTDGLEHADLTTALSHDHQHREQQDDGCRDHGADQGVGRDRLDRVERRELRLDRRLLARDVGRRAEGRLDLLGHGRDLVDGAGHDRDLGHLARGGGQRLDGRERHQHAVVGEGGASVVDADDLDRRSPGREGRADLEVVGRGDRLPTMATSASRSRRRSCPR